VFGGCGGLLELPCPPAPAQPTLEPVTPVPPAPPGRVTAALFGDSVAESIMVPDFVRDGMAGQLAARLASMGFQAGGIGFVPAAPYQFDFNAARLLDQAPMPAGGWSTVGYGKIKGQDGPNGYSAITSWSQATASIDVSDPEVDVLYTTSDSGCPFTLSAGAEMWSIDTYAPGPPAAAEAAIALPAGKHPLTVHGPTCGTLTFAGIVAHQPVAPGRIQVEIDNLGHAAHMPWLDLQPRVREALIEQRYNISVFMWGFIAEMLINHRRTAPYLSSMEERARIARLHGGSCLIVQPTPIAATRAAVGDVERLDRAVADEEGCAYTTVLAHLWPSARWAESHGLLLIDGVHPTAAGYAQIAGALTPVLASLVRTSASASASASISASECASPGLFDGSSSRVVTCRRRWAER
jgi:hypothetical protein